MEAGIGGTSQARGNDWGIEQETPYVVFEVGRWRLATPAFHVKEAVKCPSLMLIRNSNPLVIGLMHFRRDFLPVFDLGRAFGEPEALSGRNEVVIGAARGCLFGLLADRVIDFIGIPESAMVDCQPEDPEAGANPLLQRWVLLDQQPVLLLDLDHLLDWPPKDRLSLEELRKPWAVQGG